MPSHQTIWDGKEWQRYIEDLLVLHYGPEDFQRVPDEHQGDLGIEAFTRSGIGFQCYAPKGHLSIKQRYERQRNKLSEDISKLVLNREQLETVLGQTILKRWFFLVPDHDSKQLIAFGNKKAEEIRAHNLPYIAPGFEVHIHTDASFPLARNRLFGATQLTIPLQLPAAQDEQVEDWATANDHLVQLVDGKLRKVATLTAPERRIEFRNRLIARTIEGQNVLEQIRTISPDLYETILELKAAKTKALEMESYTSAAAAHDRLNAALDSYLTTLRNKITVLPHSADVVLGLFRLSVKWRGRVLR